MALILSFSDFTPGLTPVELRQYFFQYSGWIRRGLVVTMPGSSSGLAWSLNKCLACGGLSMVLLQLKDPLELFMKSREFLPGSRFLSRRDMT